MDQIFARILDNAILVAALLFVVGIGLASIGLGDPGVVALLLCGTVLMLKSGRAADGIRDGDAARDTAAEAGR